MTTEIDLDGEWSLYWADDFPEFLMGDAEPVRHRIVAAVPEPVHSTLIRHGLLEDPNQGTASLRARWVEEQFWVYRKTFDVPETAEGQAAWLIFEHLETDAVILVNGIEVGRHRNAHRPARFDISPWLRAGETNRIVVRVDAGLYGVADKPGAAYQNQLSVLLNKRHWLRKGQWQAGWDWQQRLMNVGILGSVRIRFAAAPLLFDASLRAIPTADLSAATFRAEAEVYVPGTEPVRATLRCSVIGTESVEEREIQLSPGWSRHAIETVLENPELWWPVGHGDPITYSVAVVLVSGGMEHGCRIATGVRRVEIDQSPHPGVGRHFILRINGKPIFCKGGNWVPPDMLPTTVSEERIETLVDAAIEANFNILRIWGGGVWAGPTLLDQCDAKGLLVWHDLLFACSKYPGDDPDFAKDARTEVEWGLRAYGHHPSVVVWCGNNEIEWGDWHWGYDDRPVTHPHYALFHHDFPLIARREAPHTAYWISSPFSPDQAHPNDPTVGDQHPWAVSLQVAGGADWWEYRTYVDRFPNEGGVLGASSLGTLRSFLPERERCLLSASWEHHDNPYAYNDLKPGTAGHAYQTVRLWTGRDPFAMDWETYAVASGLLQGEGIAEYISNYRRRMFSSASAIFWMYNDSWPATHGWTIVDYHLRRKLAFHPVRRAFAPVTVVCAIEAGRLVVTGVNETATAWSGRVRIGWFDGGGPTESVCDRWVVLPPNASTRLVESEDRNARESAYAVLSNANGIPVARHRIHRVRFHEFGLAKDPAITISRIRDGFRFECERPVWGVCLDVEGDISLPDNAFDLLPGDPLDLAWPSDALPPRIVITGNDLVHGRSLRAPNS